jgi:hypothetical protein
MSAGFHVVTSVSLIAALLRHSFALRGRTGGEAKLKARWIDARRGLIAKSGQEEQPVDLPTAMQEEQTDR